jgi:hypothetical protein
LKTSNEIIERALAAQKAKDGIRMPVRFPASLIARVRDCAADVDEPIGDWVNKACRQWLAGKFSCVADRENAELATRETSEVITVKAPAGMTGAQVKAAVSACCCYCESRRIIYHPEEVGNYLLEPSE